MRDWPPYCMDGPWPDESDHLIAALGLAHGPDATAHDVEAELRHLTTLRSRHRRSRWTITELWIGAIGLALLLVVTGWGLLMLPVAAFTLLAVHQADRQDVSRGRGRELDVAIADARARLREMGENS